MVYVDTSVLLALLAHESSSASVACWYAATKAELVSATWCVTELASALAIKQRTGQMNSEPTRAAWEQFCRLVANDLKLVPLAPADFHRAATLTLDVASSLRAGDGLHLACALQAGAKSIATRRRRDTPKCPALEDQGGGVCVISLAHVFAQRQRFQHARHCGDRKSRGAGSVLSNPAPVDTRTLQAAVLRVSAARLQAAWGVTGKGNTLVRLMLLLSNVRVGVG